MEEKGLVFRRSFNPAARSMNSHTQLVRKERETSEHIQLVQRVEQGGLSRSPFQKKVPMHLAACGMNLICLRYTVNIEATI